MLCLRGFYTGFYLQQQHGEIQSFARKPCMELRSWIAPKVKLAFSSSPQAYASHLGGCKSSCWMQCLMPGRGSSSAQQWLLCLHLSAFCMEEPTHHSCPQTPKQQLRGLFWCLQVWDSLITQTGVSVWFSCSTRFNSSKSASTAELLDQRQHLFGVDESFVIDISALRFFGFIDSSFQKSERLWSFMININLIRCQWGLTQPQHMSFFLGFTLGRDVRRRLCSTCLVMANWLELGLCVSCAWEKLQDWIDFELSFPLNCSNPPTPLPKYS